MKNAALLLLIVFICSFSGLSRTYNCSKIFNLSKSPKSTHRFFYYTKNHYTYDDYKMMKDFALQYSHSIDYPGKYSKRKRTMFRGMKFNSVDEVAKILNEGFNPDSSKYKKTYFSETPSVISYAVRPDNGNIFNYEDHTLHLMFELDYTKMPKMRPSARIGYATKQHVTAEAIRYIHIFDKESNNEFSVSVFTPKDFLELISTK